MNSSPGFDEILVRSGPAVSSLCLAAVLVSNPVAAHASSPSRVSRSFTETLRSISLYTGSIATESVTMGERVPAPKQLSRFLLNPNGKPLVPLLAYICNVSRNTYYGWMKGETVSTENEERILRAIEVLGSISGRHSDMIGFLTKPTAIGTPAEQIRAGRFEVAMGMAATPEIQVSKRTTRSGRRLMSLRSAASAVTPARLRDARRIRDVGREPNPDAYIDDESMNGIVALGPAIVVR
jgi:hypothetical protein